VNIELNKPIKPGYLQLRTRNGQKYGYFCVGQRSEDKKNVIKTELYLGKVIDEEHKIFYNKKHGNFMYDLEKGYTQIPKELLSAGILPMPVGIIDFGAPWILHEFILKSGYIDVINTVFPENKDNILSLLSFRLLSDGKAHKFAFKRYNNSYAKILYPNAHISSQNISKILDSLGTNKAWNQFYPKHLEFVSKMGEQHGILIDSTGLPNNIKFPLTKVSNHNGKISKEIRMILAIDRRSKLPIYFRSVAGNIVDVSTLKATLNEITSFGIKIEDVILDAGYFSASNICKLNEFKIPYLLRLPAKGNLYKDLITNHLPDQSTIENSVSYLKREFFANIVRKKYFNSVLNAYVIIDIEKKAQETVKYLRKAKENGIAIEEANTKLKTTGVFVLISSKNLSVDEVIPMYYQRQSVEQVFDLYKNEVKVKPIRIQTEQRLRGYLLLTFMGTTVLVSLKEKLKKIKMTPLEMFEAFRNARANVYNDGRMVVYEGDKDINEVLKALKISYPECVELYKETTI
jgi:hypothetical protein